MDTQEKTKSQVKSSGILMLVVGCFLSAASVYLIYQDSRMGMATGMIGIICLATGAKSTLKARQMSDF